MNAQCSGVGRWFAMGAEYHVAKVAKMWLVKHGPWPHTHVPPHAAPNTAMISCLKEGTLYTCIIGVHFLLRASKSSLEASLLEYLMSFPCILTDNGVHLPDVVQ